MFLSAQIHSLDKECPLLVTQPKLIPAQWMVLLKVYVCLQNRSYLIKSAARSASVIRVQCVIMWWILCLWFRASLIYFNNCPTSCNTKQSIYYSASSLCVFRVSTTPVINSTQNCNYSLRYWSYFLCSYLPSTWRRPRPVPEFWGVSSPLCI
jgi:hypothetical protein